jgi:hypothetical protein
VWPIKYVSQITGLSKRGPPTDSPKMAGMRVEVENI